MSKRPAEGMRIAVGTGIALAGAGAGTLPLIPQIQDKLDSEQKKSALVFSSAFGSVALGGVGLALILPNGAITVRNPASAVLSSIAPS